MEKESFISQKQTYGTDSVAELTTSFHATKKYCDTITPSNRVHKQEKNAYYCEWKNKNKYYKKQFSILGDSISTLAGYNPEGYNIFFSGENCEKSGVKEIQDTWWGKIIDFFGGRLLVNDSWSGSRVTRLPNSDCMFPSGCSDERTSNLHINNVKPDVIIIYLGTNDWAFGVELDGTHFLIDALNLQYFRTAYGDMLLKIESNYPCAEIWCCTLNTTFISSNPSFKFPYTYGGTHIEKYNQIIKDMANLYKCNIIDLYGYHLSYDSIDGTHPNARGMNTLATMVIRGIGGKDVEQFMDCENEQHEFCRIYACGQGVNRGYRVCAKCGKIKHESETLKVADSKSPYIWNSANMDANNIDSFAVTFGSFPIIHISYVGEKLTVCNRINGSRDGGRSFPNGFFDEKIVQLTSKQREEITNYIRKIDFSTWKTEDCIRQNYEMGACGFCVQNSFSCIFKNGKHFKCYEPKYAAFDRFVDFLKGFCDSNWFDPYYTESKSNQESAVPSEEKYDVGAEHIDLPKVDIGTVIDGRYTLLKLICAYGMVKEYFAVDKRIGKYWVVKIYTDVAKDISKNMLIQEAGIMNGLNHPAMQIVDIIHMPACFAVAREYIEGETLESIVANHGAQPTEQVVDWSKQICGALCYIHSLNPPRIYLDMKPENVVLQPNNSIKIINSGMMCIYQPNHTENACCLGTRGYAAPEQFGGRGHPDARTDIYSLGITMYRLITGSNPTEPPYEFVPICQMNPNLPKGLEYIINKCTQLDPKDRYQSCSALLGDLNLYQHLPPKKGLFSKLFGNK